MHYDRPATRNDRSRAEFDSDAFVSLRRTVDPRGCRACSAATRRDGIETAETKHDHEAALVEYYQVDLFESVLEKYARTVSPVQGCSACEDAQCSHSAKNELDRAGYNEQRSRIDTAERRDRRKLEQFRRRRSEIEQNR
jgi:hypothetical protein